MPRISVIIPIFNSERYLDNLISCINAQTYTDYEVIFINDGSTDNSREILQKYCDNSDNKILVNKKNGGVSSARNLGLQLAKGELIVFWDADDDISPYFLQEMISNLEDNKVIICGYEDVGTRFGNLIKVFNEKEIYSLVHKNEVAILQDLWLFNTLWNKIFSRRIIIENNISFNEESTFGEDAEFVSNYIKYINWYKIINKPLYTYIRRNINASSKYHQNIYINHKSLYESILNSLDNCSENFKKCEKEIKVNYFKSSISSLWHYCKYSKNGTNKEIKFALKDMARNKNLLYPKINPFLKLVLKLKWVWLTKLYYKIVLKGGK